MLMNIDEYESQAGESYNIGTMSPNTDLILEALRGRLDIPSSVLRVPRLGQLLAGHRLLLVGRIGAVPGTTSER
jgi:hypothetical protein